MSSSKVGTDQSQLYRSIEHKFAQGDYEPKIFFSSSEHMVRIDDGTVQLIVTSPPYNVGKEYGVYDDSKSRGEYLDYLDTVWSECKRILCKGGRIAVNVANIDRKPYNFICADIATRLRDKHGFLMRGDVIWNKGASVGVSTAWGSWRSASDPSLRDVHEHILIFCKDDWKLHSANNITSVSPTEFCTFTRSVWDIRTEANGVSNSHPAPFPLELPKRLIQLYTYVDDTVLDPFLGSGTTCVAAKCLARKSIGYEIDKSYKQIIKTRIAKIKELDFKAEAIRFNGKPLEERTGPVI